MDRQKPIGERNAIQSEGLVRADRAVTSFTTSSKSKSSAASGASTSSSQLTPSFQCETSLNSIEEDEYRAVVSLQRARELLMLMSERKRRHLRNTIVEFSLSPHTKVYLKDERGSKLPVSVEHFMHLNSTINFNSAVISNEQAGRIVRNLRDSHKKRILATIREFFVGPKANIIYLTNAAGVKVPVAVSDVRHYARQTAASSSINPEDLSTMNVPQPLLDAYFDALNRPNALPAIPSRPSSSIEAQYGDSNAYSNRDLLEEEPSPPHYVPRVAITISSNEEHDYRPGLIDALVLCCCCGWLASTFGMHTAKKLLLIITTFAVCLCALIAVAVMLTTLNSKKKRENEFSTTISASIAQTTTSSEVSITDHSSRASSSLSTTLSSTLFSTVEISLPTTSTAARTTNFPSTLTSSKPTSTTPTSTPVLQTTTQKT